MSVDVAPLPLFLDAEGALLVTIEALERFSHGGCQRSLLHVAVVSMLRGVRHYWCFHTARFKHKFDLKVKVVNGETTLMVLKRLLGV